MPKQKTMNQQIKELFIPPKPRGATKIAYKPYKDFRHYTAVAENKFAIHKNTEHLNTLEIKLEISKKALEKIINCSPKEAGLIANKCLNTLVI